MIIEHIVTQHAEEAAFLWFLRDAAARQSHYDLADLAALDERVEANIDGLRIAGDEGWEICRQALELEGPGEVFAAAVLAFESGDGERVNMVLNAGCASDDTFRGLVSALGWLSQEQYGRWIPSMLSANSPEYRRLGLAAASIHRQDPGKALDAALGDPDANIQVRALRAVGELKRRDLLPALHERLTSQDSAVRFWASWSAALLGDRSALEILRTFALADPMFREQALQILLRIMDSKDAQACLNGLSKSPDAFRLTIIGTGIAGDPVVVPWLIQQMAVPEQARVAGEAFSMITGVDIAYEDLEGEWPEGFEAGPSENPEDEDVAMDSDEDLPWPEPARIQAWWEKNKNQFRSGVRYLCGQPISVEQCRRVLASGYQRQRWAAALELALRQPDAPVINTCAPGFKQLRMFAEAD